MKNYQKIPRQLGPEPNGSNSYAIVLNKKRGNRMGNISEMRSAIKILNRIKFIKVPFITYELSVVEFGVLAFLSICFWATLLILAIIKQGNI